MTPDQLLQLQEHLEDTIQKKVNGRIELLQATLTEYMKKNDTWQSEAKPALQVWANLNGFGKIMAYGFSVVAGAAGLLLIIEQIIKNFMKIK